jgi:hypothetical protein
VGTPSQVLRAHLLSTRRERLRWATHSNGWIGGVAGVGRGNFWCAVDLANKLKGTGEKVVIEEVLCAVAEDDAGSGHHAAQRVPDHPYLARQLSGGETWTDPQGGYPSGCRLTNGGSGT